MLANFGEHAESSWYFMEVPRTGTSTIERTLRHYFPNAKAPYQKHWPILPPEDFRASAASIVSIRNPFSRAVSCWQYFTKPGQYTFKAWLEERLKDGFFDVFIEARPQSFWYCLHDELHGWDFVLQQESLEEQFHAFIRHMCDDPEIAPLQRYNDINGQWVNRVKAQTSRPIPWVDYYVGPEEELVLELYAADFEAFDGIYSKILPKYTSL